MSSGSDFDRVGVERIIEDEIRPLLRVHGGDLLLLSTDDGHVELEFQGACRACALKIVTYAIGVRAPHPSGGREQCEGARRELIGCGA